MTDPKQPRLPRCTADRSGHQCHLDRGHPGPHIALENHRHGKSTDIETTFYKWGAVA